MGRGKGNGEGGSDMGSQAGSGPSGGAPALPVFVPPKPKYKHKKIKGFAQISDLTSPV